jgi:hypothetical protein
MVGVLFITSDISTLTDGAISFVSCGVEITEGVLSATATAKDKIKSVNFFSVSATPPWISRKT